MFLGCIVPDNHSGDSHSCIASAGYFWCNALAKCIRPWEENCTNTTTVLGGDEDEHGCKGSAGYSWCAALNRCIRPWEENCTALNATNTADLSSPAINSINATSILGNNPDSFAKSFCNQSDVSGVFVCGEYVKIVSSLANGGNTFYKDGQVYTQCPLTAGGVMTTACRMLMLGNNCVEQKVC